jgi:chromosome segregation ATPase
MNTINFKDLIKKDDKFERFEPNPSINHKESFDDTNKTMNSLNEEVLQLKRKVRQINELENKIDKLKQENSRLTSELEERQNDGDKIKSVNEKLEDVLKENSLLKRELHQLKNNKVVDKKEKMKVDINKLKQILQSKLEDKRDERVDELLSKYNIRHNREIDKDIMTNMIKEIVL